MGEQPTAEQKKEIKRQVKKETRKTKMKTMVTLIVLVAIVGAIIWLLAGANIGFGDGSGFGNGEDIVASIKDKISELKGDISEVNTQNALTSDATTEESKNDNAESADNQDMNQGDNTSSEESGTMVMQATIQENQIIYNGATYDNVEDFKTKLSTYDYTEGEMFNIVDVNSNIKTYEMVKQVIEEMKLVPNYVDDATLE